MRSNEALLPNAGASLPKLLNLNLASVREMLPSTKFSIDFPSIPRKPANLGYLLAQAKFALEGELKQTGGTLKTTLKADSVRVATEMRITDCTEAAFSAKLDEKTLNRLSQAAANGSTREFITALAAPLELSIKSSYRWKYITIVPVLGFELSLMPVLIRVAGELEAPFLQLEGASFNLKATVKGGFNVGLSQKGWLLVIKRAGAEAVKRFLAQNAPRVLAWLVSEAVLPAVVVAGTVAGTVALTTLCAWLAEDARRKGTLLALSSWYVSAYTAKVFREPRPAGAVSFELISARDQLVRVAEVDAGCDARSALRSALGPLAEFTDGEALESFRRRLMAENGQNESAAKTMLRNRIMEIAQKRAGQ